MDLGPLVVLSTLCIFGAALARFLLGIQCHGDRIRPSQPVPAPADLPIPHVQENHIR